MVVDLKLQTNIIFFGSKHGSDLIKIIHESDIAVVPSAYEEPYGGVSLELLAAGKNIIVSSHTGLVECIGDAGLVFKRGDAYSLYQSMLKLLSDQSLAKSQLENAVAQLELFDEVRLTKGYLEIYERVIQKVVMRR